MAYMAFASVGYFTLPFLMASEVYPLQNRGLLGGMTTTFASLLIFGSLKMTPSMMDNIGLTNTMLIFGIASLLGVIFIYIFLPETKNLTLQEIEEYYSDLRPTLVSQRTNLSNLESKSSTSNKIKDVSKKTIAATSADVINLANSIFKNKKASSVLNLNADNKKVPRPSADSVLLQKIVKLAKTIKSRRKKGSKENIEELKNKEGPDHITGKGKLEGITDTSDKPGTSRKLSRTSSKFNILEQPEQPAEVVRKKTKKQSDESIKSTTSKKSNRDKYDRSDSD
ncbi:unnamed protein product [Spodoptera littoralis]|uniref:Major facilitator superfamily (MFS) profile domain-containing protein n=1 Tax=Spodoptera littoralis TaxID=7109 RepID=A0A9P0N7P0_SPOLI|nr:unnamed protein product [Spodoptera littoralis]CAH1644524.1 unnamed protein product [Spodoptera littoralis]